MFYKLINENFFIEFTKYETQNGLLLYGTAKNDIQKAKDNDVWIANPEGFRTVKYNNIKNIISFYLNVDDTNIIDRLNKRDSNKIELIRRFLTDTGMYTGIEKEVDYVINNNGNIQNTVLDIIKILKERNII
jgi:guanylate kinase